MSEGSKASACSIGIHLMVCLLFFGLVRGVNPERKTLVIDFSLSDAQSAQPLPRTEPKSVPASRIVPAKAEQARVPPVREAVREPAPQIQREAATQDQVAIAAPAPIPAPDAGKGSAGPNAGAPRSGGDLGSARSTSSSGPGTEAERPGVRYVKAHFVGIRNAIISKLSYPRLARRNGWAGTVRVSFVVNEDGGVNNVKVLTTSGFEVLDNNVVETIRRCSPYPKPPVVAELIMPITYRLDD